MRTLRQHLVIARSLAGSREFSQNINVNFDPHEVIVREVAYVAQDGEGGAYSIRSNLADNSVNSYLCTFQTARNDADGIFQSVVGHPQCVFSIQNFVNNINYNFQVVNVVTGTMPAIAGQLYLHLEFVRYL